MATYIQNLLNSALGDGARASKFDADIFFRNPALFADSDSQRTLVKTATFPGRQHEQIDFKFKGRSIPVKGQNKYTQTWSCSYYLPEDHKLKAAFETWIESLDQKHNYTADVQQIPGLAQSQKLNADSYTTEIHLFQKNFENSQDTAHYVIYNAFPIEVSAVEYSAESVGTVQEFTVTFAYSHYYAEVVKGKDGNFIDQLVDKVKNGVDNLLANPLGQLGDLAGDAIGAGKAALDSALNAEVPGIPSLTGGLGGALKSLETAAKTNEQIAKGPETMKNSIFDAIQDGKDSISNGFATTRAKMAAAAGDLGQAEDND